MGLLVNENRWGGGQFFPKNWELVLSRPCNYVKQSNNKNAYYIFEELSIYINFFPVRFFPILLWILTENRTKLRKLKRQNTVKNTFAKIQIAFAFLSTLALRDHSKWRVNKNKLEKGNNSHPNVYSKSNK